MSRTSINVASLEATAKAIGPGDVVRPLHDGYGFSSIPGSLWRLLTGQPGSGLAEDVTSSVPEHVDQVVLFLVDGMGWNHLVRAQSRSSPIAAFFAAGNVSRLTSQFPSTTAAHVTTMMSGLPVGEHGFYEWYVFDPTIGDVLETFLFSRAHHKKRETLRHEGVDPRQVYRFGTFADRLRGQEVETHMYQPTRMCDSTYNKYACAGSSVHPWLVHAEWVVELNARLRSLQAAHQRAFHYVYLPDVDSLVHQYGTSSEAALIALEQIVRLIHDYVIKPLGDGMAQSGKPGNVAVFVTADHGAMDVDPGNVQYLNQTHPGIEKMFRTNRAGKPIVPVGMNRDMMLFVNDVHVDSVEATLSRDFAGIATVRRVADLVAQGWFGDRPTSSFLDRVGNLLILPESGYAVWWYCKDVFQVWNRAEHGGVSPDEMFIPFWADSFCL